MCFTHMLFFFLFFEKAGFCDFSDVRGDFPQNDELCNYGSGIR